MAYLVNRIKSLERKTPIETNGYPPPPRIAGKSRSQAMRDHIGWLRRCLESTESATMRKKLQLDVFRIEVALQGELAAERHYRNGVPYAEAYRPYVEWLRLNTDREPGEARRKCMLYYLAIVEKNIAASEDRKVSLH